MTDSLRPLAITFLGAGSQFCPQICGDLLLTPGAEHGELRLVDVDESRLLAMAGVIERLTRDLDRPGWTVRATTDRRDVLAGTDYAICCVEVSGLDCVRFDNDIPLRYGVDQCIGDTVGPGGLFKGLRTIPVFLDILADMAELCPGAPMLNYTNPMSMMCLAAARAVPEVPVVGLCHSVQHTSIVLSLRLGIPHTELDYRCAGVNHLAWFTELTHEGRDVYPRLQDQARSELYGDPADSDNAWADDVGADRVRKDMMLHYGAFITESSGHLSEYVSHYRTSESGRSYLGPGYDGESRFYATNWPIWRADADAERERLLSGEAPIERPERGLEFASYIVEAAETGRPFVFHGNVPNGPERLVDNLPSDSVVEVGCTVDQGGVRPQVHGLLPAQMAHVCERMIAVHDLGATAAIERSREAARHALLLDPLTSAQLTPHQIVAMADELFAAEAPWLPGF